MERRSVKSTMRTFEVLELFEAQRRPMRLQEIHQILGYPQSSTTNMLKSMVVMGYLNYNRSSRTYLPTTKVSNLGSWLPNFIHFDGCHYNLVEKIQEETDETVSLCSQNDLFVQYLIVREPSHEFKMPPPQGSLRMLVDSAAGLALISSWSDKEIDKICRYTNYYELNRAPSVYAEAPHDRVSLAEVMEEVREVRHVGYSYRAGKPIPEVAAIAMPLLSTSHGIPLAIGVGGLTQRIAERKNLIIESMRRHVSEFNVTNAA
ncbi:IclR family transcriptional regulator [Cupriavidus taiwanensis]|uniref:IclR family transcriptional regulator n=1 Tax=Cupriavidus taiwanensis TaxID=164546 RepID=UPI000E1A8C4B|nr:IclR family transcriptional regulator [Cupriavidus taiwanensis]SOZ29617.1 Transcriptional regulator, IclR family [Cupriavidus taiwanensis]SPA34449.1 Transcriptional regulator, IclR family [Cupriavidus taiwanensis]